MQKKTEQLNRSSCQNQSRHNPTHRRSQLNKAADLTANEVGWLQAHMSHTQEMHEQEVAKNGKLLLAVEARKKLEEIELSDTELD